MSKKQCTVENCNKRYEAKGLCYLHYKRLQYSGSIELKPIRLCSIEGCGKKHRQNGFCEPHSRKAEYFSIQRKFDKAKSAAKKKNKFWNLSKEEYEQILGNKICYYCEESFAKEGGSNLDRIEHTNRSYEINNVIPACGKCNSSRNTKFSVEEFKIMIQALKKFKKENLLEEETMEHYSFCSDFYY